MKERFKTICAFILVLALSIAFMACITEILEILIETNTTAGALAFVILVFVLTEIFYKLL